MATIAVFDLPISGLELFSDSENYMDELNDEDLRGINGGIGLIGLTIIATLATAVGAANYYLYREGSYRYKP